MQKGLVHLIYLSVILIFIGCGSNNFLSTDEVKERAALKTIPTSKDYPEANGIILYELHDVNLRINSEWNLETYETVHKITKLFKNVEDNSYESIYLNNGEHLESISARTIKADGTVILMKDEDFYTTQGETESSEFYSDRRSVKFTYPATEKECIVEYVYTIRNDYPFMYSNWFIQDMMPKVTNIFKLTLPKLLMLPANSGGAGWDWKYLPLNIDLPNPAVAANINPEQIKKNESITLEWKVDNIPAFERETKMPPIRDYIQYVKFAPTDFTEWNDLSNWYYKRYKSKIELDGIVKEKALSLTKNCKTESEKIDALFKYVQKLRYISINMNNEGIIPQEPSKVIEKEYGDCKDKSTLLLSMLRCLNIEAFPVLVLTADQGTALDYFPSWNFNHMIVKAVGKDYLSYWLDATDEFGSINTLPSMDQGIKVLVISDDGTSKVENTPTSSYRSNKIDIDINLELNEDLEGSYKIAFKYSGEPNIEKRYFFKDKTAEEIKKYCRTLMANDVVNAEFSNCKVEYKDNDTAVTILSFEVKTKEIASKQNELVLLNSDPFDLGFDLKWFEKEKRSYPIKLDYPYIINKTINFNYPKNKVAFKSNPSMLNINEKGLIYKKEHIAEEGILMKMYEEFRIPDRIIETKNYQTIRAAFEKINAKNKEKIVFTSK